jgi:sterol desaturase/sphingolipid hydroxylase (fatty acid hydroxylase superfamily)
MTAWSSAQRRAAWDRIDWSVFSLLGGMWLVCLSATIWLVTSPQLNTALAATISDLGLPFAVNGARVTDGLLSRLLMVSIAVLPALTIEAVACGARKSAIGRLLFNRSTSATYDWLIFALNFFSIWRLLELVFSLGGITIVSALLVGMVSAIAGNGWRISTGDLLLDCVLAFLLFTLSDYAGHRFLHTRVFFALHRMHHTATEMSVVTLWRNNPGVAVIESLYKVWPLALFDIPVGIVTGVGLGVLAYEHLIHSNIRWTWGWFGRWILHPPAAHWLHHSIDPNHFNCNLGTIVLWDRLFGTWVDPRTAMGQLGIAGGAYNTGNFFGEIVRDLRTFAFDQWRRPGRPRESQRPVDRPALPMLEQLSIDRHGERR